MSRPPRDLDTPPILASGAQNANVSELLSDLSFYWYRIELAAKRFLTLHRWNADVNPVKPLSRRVKRPSRVRLGDHATKLVQELAGHLPVMDHQQVLVVLLVRAPG